MRGGDGTAEVAVVCLLVKFLHRMHVRKKVLIKLVTKIKKLQMLCLMFGGFVVVVAMAIFPFLKLPSCVSRG